jgi:cytidylate kinase
MDALAQSVTSSTINFQDKSTFWSFYNGGYNFYEEVEKGVISTQGSNLAVELFLRKIVKSEQKIVSNTEQCLIDCETQGKAILYEDGKLFEDAKFEDIFGNNRDLNFQYYIKII